MDPVLNSMAEELKGALVARGLDPKDPPGGGPPSSAAFAEYKRRGGIGYESADDFAKDLVERVGEV